MNRGGGDKTGARIISTFVRVAKIPSWPPEREPKMVLMKMMPRSRKTLFGVLALVDAWSDVSER